MKYFSITLAILLFIIAQSYGLSEVRADESTYQPYKHEKRAVVLTKGYFQLQAGSFQTRASRGQELDGPDRCIGLRILQRWDAQDFSREDTQEPRSQSVDV